MIGITAYILYYCSNPEVSCQAIPSIDLSLWSDGLVDPTTSLTTGLPPARRPHGRGYRSHQRQQGSQTQNRNSNRRGRQNVPRYPRGQQRNSGGRVRSQNRIRAGNNRKSFIPSFWWHYRTNVNQDKHLYLDVIFYLYCGGGDYYLLAKLCQSEDIVDVYIIMSLLNKNTLYIIIFIYVFYNSSFAKLQQ